MLKTNIYLLLLRSSILVTAKQIQVQNQHSFLHYCSHPFNGVITSSSQLPKGPHCVLFFSHFVSSHVLSTISQEKVHSIDCILESCLILLVVQKPSSTNSLLPLHLVITCYQHYHKESRLKYSRCLLYSSLMFSFPLDGLILCLHFRRGYVLVLFFLFVRHFLS